MTAKEVFEINSDFKNSPLLETVRNLHTLFSSLSVPYAVIGGMAVVRSGAVRTTLDVDILITRAGWQKVRDSSPGAISHGVDSAVDSHTAIDIDILFPGNEWDMVIPMPEPEEVHVFDEDLGAWFIDLLHLIELKTAVFMKKRDEDGIEMAAKDLTDIVALIENNRETIDDDFIRDLSPAVRTDFKRILMNIETNRQ